MIYSKKKVSTNVQPHCSMDPNGRDKFHQMGDTHPSKGYIEVVLHGSIRRVREVSMEEHCFAYSFTKEYTIVLLLDLHPMYFQY